jgi:hypothetical protein
MHEPTVYKDDEREQDEIPFLHFYALALLQDRKAKEVSFETLKVQQPTYTQGV